MLWPRLVGTVWMLWPRLVGTVWMLWPRLVGTVWMLWLRGLSQIVFPTVSVILTLRGGGLRV